jgi:cell division protein FtsL
MTRVNLLLLAVLVGCALSLVTSRHQARQLTTELTREQARMRAYEVEFGQLSLEQSTWAMPARVEKIARELRLHNPGPGRVEIVDVPASAARAAMKNDAAGAAMKNDEGVAIRGFNLHGRDAASSFVASEAASSFVAAGVEARQ